MCAVLCVCAGICVLLCIWYMCRYLCALVCVIYVQLFVCSCVLVYMRPQGSKIAIPQESSHLFFFWSKVSHWSMDLILQSGWTHWLGSFRGLSFSVSPGLGVQAVPSNARLIRWALGINSHFHAWVTPPSHLGTLLLPESCDRYSLFYVS